MARVSFLFLIAGLIAYGIGLTGVMSVAAHLAWILFAAFLVLFIVGRINGPRLT